MAATKTFLSLVFFLSFCIISCVQTKFLQTGETYSKWTGPVKIFQEPPNDVIYIELGWVTGRMNDSFSDWGVILEAMQEKAAQKGANGIILIDKVKSKQMSLSNTEDGLVVDSNNEKNLMAIAIRIKN